MKNSGSTSSFGSSLRKSVNKLTASASGVSLVATSALSASSEALNNRNSISDCNNNNNPPATIISGAHILTQSLAVTNLIFGIYGIELWHYNEATGKLHNVNLNPRNDDDEETGLRATNMENISALLVKRKPQDADTENDYATDDAIEAYNKLIDTSRKDYVAANPTDPGVGLSGVLWAESTGSALPGVLHLPKMGLFRHDDGGGGSSSSERNLNTSFRRRGSGMKRRGSVGGNLGGSFRNVKSPGGSFRNVKKGVVETMLGSHGQLVWRNVDELAIDPDQVREDTCVFISYAHIICTSYVLFSYHMRISLTMNAHIIQPNDNRLQTLAKAGFKLAAGIPFDVNGYRGIVIMYGNPHAESSKLNHPANLKFMCSAANVSKEILI